MAEERVMLQGHLVMEVTAPDGRLIARVEGSNMVVDGGRRLLARLLAGSVKGPAFQIVAGVSDKETVDDLTALYNTDGLPRVDPMVETSGGFIHLAGTFEESKVDRHIKEAGLMLTCDTEGGGESTLYNRVLVKPSQLLRTGELLTLKWTLSFAPEKA